MKARLPREPKQPKADWLSWALHLVFGLVVGAACGAYLGLQCLPAEFARVGQLFAFAAGIALVTGAAASHWGDALWMGRSLFGSREYPRDSTSAVVSAMIGLAGVGLAACALFMGADSMGSDSGVDLILLLPAGVLLALCIHGFKSGTAIGVGAYVHQHESPFFYWLLISSQLVGALWMVLAALS